MKKLLTFLALLSLFSSCTDEVLPVVPVVELQKELELNTLFKDLQEFGDTNSISITPEKMYIDDIKISSVSLTKMFSYTHYDAIGIIQFYWDEQLSNHNRFRQRLKFATDYIENGSEIIEIRLYVNDVLKSTYQAYGIKSFNINVYHE